MHLKPYHPSKIRSSKKNSEYSKAPNKLSIALVYFPHTTNFCYVRNRKTTKKLKMLPKTYTKTSKSVNVHFRSSEEKKNLLSKEIPLLIKLLKNKRLMKAWSLKFKGKSSKANSQSTKLSSLLLNRKKTPRSQKVMWKSSEKNIPR